METQIKHMIRLFCIMIMFMASLLPAMHIFNIAQASTLSSNGQAVADDDIADDDDDDDGDSDDDNDDDGDSDDDNDDDGDDDDDGIDGDDDDDDDREIYGVITAFPPSGRDGTWQVGGMTFVANAGTRFEQEGAPFAVGLTVEVEYIVQNGVNIATEIESDDDYININQTPNVGVISQMGGVSAASTDSTSAAWVIGGVTYQVGANTQLDGQLAVGMQAAVRSYADAGGLINASLISGLDNHIYLPTVLQ